MTYADTAELVFEEYARCYDLDVALNIVPMDDATRAQLLEDKLLAARIAVALAKKQSDIFTKVDFIAENADNFGVRLSALDKLGKMVYPKRFKDTGGALMAGKTYKVTYEEVEASA